MIHVGRYVVHNHLRRCRKSSTWAHRSPASMCDYIYGTVTRARMNRRSMSLNSIVEQIKNRINARDRIGKNSNFYTRNRIHGIVFWAY